jgi:hypothetical protein
VSVPRDLVKLPDTPTTPHRGLLSTFSRFIPGGSPSKPRSTALPGASERQEAEQVQLQEQGQGEVDTQLDAEAGANEAGLMPSKEPETEPDVMITVDGEEAQAEGRGPEGEPEVSDEDAEEGAEDEYEVEQIVDHRVGKPVSRVTLSVARPVSVRLRVEPDADLPYAGREVRLYVALSSVIIESELTCRSRLVEGIRTGTQHVGT